MPYCVPVCKGCAEAGSCPKGELPASAYVIPKRKIPRRAAVAATYPRDVRPVYVELACGHLTNKEAILFYSVWQPDVGEGTPEYWCDIHQRWVKVTVKEIPTQLVLDPPF